MKPPVWRWWRRRSAPFRLALSLLLTSSAAVLAAVVADASGDFDPYTLNGGLVTAVAGRDYVVLAADTRLIGDSGYNIAERYHVSSRLWAATATATHPRTRAESIVAPDGSLAIDLETELRQLQSASGNDEVNGDGNTRGPLRLLRESIDAFVHQPTIWIGSVGCQADCEQLKRTVRADLRAAQYFGEASAAAATTPDQVSVALSQILYGRRTFPYYSFCALAGLSRRHGGQAYGYDAIGSYEQLAVTCAGTGSLLLQPILDRRFRALPPARGAAVPAVPSATGEIAPPRRPGSIPPTQVDCETPEEAVNILLEAYRSVSEREIGVGDHVVFYSAQRVAANGDKNQGERVRSKIWTAPLKKH